MSKRDSLGPTGLVAGVIGLGLLGRAVARRLRRVELRGKTVLITGGSRGLGLALARRLAKNGCRLALCARDPDELFRAAEELRADGTKVFTGVCDVTQPDQVDAFVALVNAHFGGVDVLITCAATIRVGPLANMTKKDFADAMDDVFWGTFHPTMAVLPSMRAAHAGSIVHISSIGGRVAVPHLSTYSTAKFAVSGFSEAMRAELARENISVTTIAPGLMRTGSHLNAMFKGQAEKEFAWFSLGATLPITSMSADRAAAQIIDALVHREAERVLSIQAKILAFAHNFFPSLVADIMAAQNRYGLPGEGPSGEPIRGMDTRHGAPGETPLRAADTTAEYYHQFPGPFGGKRAPGQA